LVSLLILITTWPFIVIIDLKNNSDLRVFSFKDICVIAQLYWSVLRFELFMTKHVNKIRAHSNSKIELLARGYNSGMSCHTFFDFLNLMIDGYEWIMLL
jgi:hypothetical protein